MKWVFYFVHDGDVVKRELTFNQPLDVEVNSISEWLLKMGKIGYHYLSHEVKTDETEDNEVKHG